VNRRNIPPFSDHLPIALRAYAAPTFTEIQDSDEPDRKDEDQSQKRPIPEKSAWTLVFDTETTTDPGQALRFGTYQLFDAEALVETGIFYDPEADLADIETVRRYAELRNVVLHTRQTFVDEIFFGRAYQWRATIVGFNLPFDISRLAIRHGTARNRIDAEQRSMDDAFTFKLSEQKIYPNVRIQHLSRKSSSISFAATMHSKAPPKQHKRNLSPPIRRGHFIDVGTIANALFARGFGLGELADFLKTEHRKQDFEAYDGPVTGEMIDYAIGDVEATWDCYVDLMARLKALNLPKTLPEKIRSEASIGKGYLREMGVKPWRDAQPGYPPDLLAKIMGSYFGGRSEIRIRREIRQVILCDFLSMYPTVCTLMGLWRFVIADGMTHRDTTKETRDFLDKVDLGALQSQPTWRQLTTLVRIMPDGDIFPVRAAYGLHTESPANAPAPCTIGANYLSSDCPLWFTLADCIAAKLLGGKAPIVVEAVTFDPGPMQSGLNPIDISGKAANHVDPVEDDFFKSVIELRQSVKKQRDVASGDEREQFETEQNALKIAANATSYGVYVEVNVGTWPHRRSTTVHSSTGQPFSMKTTKAEIPGTYFHPLLATLITGAARLMLATAERLVEDQGLEWAFCDTDSMAIARPNEMAAPEFARRSQAVVDWFSELNPYNFGGSILQVEKVNDSLETGEPEPLQCWAVSSKRYALFNRTKDGEVIMRKVSAHGLGHLRAPYEITDAPAYITPPDKSVLGNGIARWHSDLWRRMIIAAIDGHPDTLGPHDHAAFSDPAISRYGATTPDLLRWFSTYNAKRPNYRDQVKPFGFLFALSAANGFEEARLALPKKPGRPKKERAIKPIAPFDSDHSKAISLAFDRESGDPVPASALKTYAQALADYHIRPEDKFLNADYDCSGTTLRRHILMVGTRHIGKESHDWERQAILGISLDNEISYGTEINNLPEKLKSFVEEYGEGKAAKFLGTSRARLQKVISNPKKPSEATWARTIAGRLPAAVALSQKVSHKRNVELRALQAAVERDGLRETARRMGLDPSNLRRRLALAGQVQKLLWAL
jgi:hypothetical protein